MIIILLAIIVILMLCIPGVAGRLAMAIFWIVVVGWLIAQCGGPAHAGELVSLCGDAGRGGVVCVVDETASYYGHFKTAEACDAYVADENTRLTRPMIANHDFFTCDATFAAAHMD